MKNSRKLTALTILVIVPLLLLLVFPMSALAQDPTPAPEADTPMPVPQATPGDTHPTEAAPMEEVFPTPESTGEAAPTESALPEVASTEPSPMEQLPTEDLATEAASQEGQSTETATTEDPIPELAASDDTASLTEIVDSASEGGLILVDDSGDPLEMGTLNAAETLLTGDPYLTSGGVTYSFTSTDCDPLTAGDQGCSTPVQAAGSHHLDRSV
jgi:hypothetical protein